MVLIGLVEGTNTIQWSLNGYQTLTAQITVSPTGVITCTGVTGGACGSNSPPGVVIGGSKTAGYTITGYLRAGSSTPVEKPVPGALCNWLKGKGGVKGIKIQHLFELEDAYYGFKNIGFKPTIREIMGVEDYLYGFNSSGNSKTGCSY